MTNLSVNVEITNLSDFLESAKEVVKKAEELETAVQQLNEIELEVSTIVGDTTVSTNSNGVKLEAPKIIV